MLFSSLGPLTSRLFRPELLSLRAPQGTQVNTAYYGKDWIIGELFEAATSLFGRNCLLQFEDFNSNDAFPLLDAYRTKCFPAAAPRDPASQRMRTALQRRRPTHLRYPRYLTYNDDIQGTAAVALAAILGAVKMRNPAARDLVSALKGET